MAKSDSRTYELSCDGFTLQLDGKGAWRRLRAPSASLEFPGIPPRVFLSGQAAAIRSVAHREGALVLELAGGSCSGLWRMAPEGDSIRSVVEIAGGDAYDCVRIELPLPARPAASLHVPTGRTYGHAVHASGPWGRDAGIPCVYRPTQFLAATAGAETLSLIGYSSLERIPHDSWGPAWKSGGFAEGGVVWAQMGCLAGEPWGLAVDASLDEAVERYREHLGRDYGARSWSEPGGAPQWLRDVRMVVTLDMFRSQGEVAHSYAHLRDLCREMSSAGMGGGVLFYLPGYHNRYDAGFPLYDPCRELGGADGFREMIDAVHQAGHRVMIHCMVWGADPCQPFFEEIEDLAAPADEAERRPGFKPVGPYVGWPSCMPPVVLEYDSGRLPMDAAADGAAAIFRTPPIPRPMEAYLTVSGVRNFAAGRLRVMLHGRELMSRPGQFAGSGSCRFRFPLRFQAGVNQVQLAFARGTPDLSRAAFRIRDAICSDPGATWTHPIVRMDVTHPRWISILRDQIAGVVTKFGVDAVHLDAGNIVTRAWAPVHEALRDALPETLFGCEFLAELGHSFFHVMQGGSLPPPGRHELTDLSWRLNGPYTRVYWHLCKAEAFVPAGPVCNHDPAQQRELAERQWTEARRWHLLPNIRLNYRDYGLDPRTRAALVEVLGGTGWFSCDHRLKGAEDDLRTLRDRLAGRPDALRSRQGLARLHAFLPAGLPRRLPDRHDRGGRAHVAGRDEPEEAHHPPRQVSWRRPDPL